MTKTLKQQTAHAIAWSFADKFGQQLLSLGLSLILARFFLSPEDYGLMGMLGLFFVLGSILLDSGFASALIRKQTVSEEELSSVFYFNIGVGLILYLMLFIAAPFIADFYEQPRLTLIARVSAVAFIINSLIITQSVNLTRAINFKTIAKSNLIALLCSVIVSLVAAIKGFGVWTLVFQNLTLIIVRNICFWIASPWRPLWLFDRKYIKGLWGFSSKILLTGVLNAVFGNLYALLIGKFYLLRDVGYYFQSDKLVSLSASSISSGLQTATYPILSQIGNEEERLKRAMRKVMRVTAFIAFPTMFGLAAIASPLVHTLLTDKWASIVPYIQKLSIAWAFIIFMNVHINIFYTKNLAGTSLKLEFVKKGIVLLAAVFTLRIGLPIFVTGLVIANLLGFAISSVVIGKKAHYALKEQLQDIFPYFFIAGLMAIAIYLLSFYFSNEWLLLIFQIILGALFYLGLVYILGSKVFKEMLELIKNKK